jgi:hypothetical protein
MTFLKKTKKVKGTGFSKKVLLPIAIFTMEIPIIPIRQRSTEHTPKSVGLGYGIFEHHRIQLASIPPTPRIGGLSSMAFVVVIQDGRFPLLPQVG